MCAKKTALMFSGQGAQKPDMVQELLALEGAQGEAARRVAEQAEQFFPIKAELDLTRTDIVQPALFVCGLAAARAFEASSRESEIAVVAGFSLGELSALTFAGVFDFETGFKLTIERGRLMQEAADKNPASMLAVVKLDNDTVENICAAHSQTYPVNYNCPGQLVVSLIDSEVKSFSEDVKAAGGRALPLKVAGGFHSPFMDEAHIAFKKVLDGTALYPPKLPVYANLTALPYPSDVAEIKNTLAKQMCNPVRWQPTIENMMVAGIEDFVEVGVGNTLTGFFEKIRSSN